MTVRGTSLKALFLILLALVTATITWTVTTFEGPGAAFPWLIGGAIGSFILAIIISFNKQSAPILAPVYALVEGTFLGAISALFQQRYPGIVVNAVLLTFGIAISMLLAYQFRIIRATPLFVKGIIAATTGIMLVYFVSFICFLVHIPVPFLHDSGPLGIGISLFILGIASLNLVLDFNLIETGTKSNAPKYMEWYGAFALVVTLFWIYLESLRLLSKLNRR